MSILDTLRKNARNIPGWKTKKKIVVLESDDWGSERARSRETLDALVKAGYNVESCAMTRSDALESNTDMEMLFDVLSAYKDSKGNHPSISAFFNLANPDFEKIRESGFKEYHYLTIEETAKKYKDHDRILSLYREGMDKGLFHAEYHGREHFHAKRWLRYLQEGQKDVVKGFELEFNGFSKSYAPAITKSLRATYELDMDEDLEFMKQGAVDGIHLFEKALGYKTNYFVPPNGPYPRFGNFEKALQDNGIQFLGGPGIQQVPDGKGKIVKKHFTLGKKNDIGQIFVTRNGIFEPHSEKRNWVDYCIEDIAASFRWNRPAVISTHRVNFVGTISAENRDNGLKQLNMLLKKILVLWPDVEFMTARQLTDLMTKKNDK